MWHLDENLAWRSNERRVSLLPTAHVVLFWGHLQLEMRMADLLVLHQALEQHDADVPTRRSVALLLNAERLHFSAGEFDDFSRMVAEAVGNLPRKTIRWVDLKVEIGPHTATFHNGVSGFSLS
jgi:hypothetical protein